MTSPLEMLEEIKKFSPTFVVEDERYVQVLQYHFDKLISFAIAVLGMKTDEPIDKGNPVQCAYVDGYNQALAEVHKLAEVGE